MITLTKVAAEKFKEIAANEGVSPSVRLRVIGSGCAGMSNSMDFSEVINELDEVFDIDGVRIIVDPVSFQYLENVELDYIENNFESGFKFINPDIKSSCGCGSSYSV